MAGIGLTIALLYVVAGLAEPAHSTTTGHVPRDGPLLEGSLMFWVLACAAFVLGGAAVIEHADYEISHGASARVSHD